MDRQIRGTTDFGARRSQKGTGERPMTTPTSPVTTTQVYRVYIKATPEAIWDAITKPEWTARYGYTGLVEYDLRPGGDYKVRPTEPFKAASEAQGYYIPDVIMDGEVL